MILFTTSFIKILFTAVISQIIIIKKMSCFICSNFSLRLDNLASKSVFVIKFARANLALKTLAAKELNSEVATYLL